jgi:hypothetical protein
MSITTNTIPKLAFAYFLADTQMRIPDLPMPMWTAFKAMRDTANTALMSWPGKPYRPKALARLQSRIDKFIEAMKWNTTVGIQAALNFSLSQILDLTENHVKDPARLQLLVALGDAIQQVFSLYSDDGESVDIDAVDEGDIAVRVWKNIMEV